MNENLNALQNSQIELGSEDMDFDQLESQLESEIDSQMQDLKFLEEEHDKIGNPATIGETVKNVVWEQFINQVGVIAGEDFIRENRGLTLDLRDSAHIQTTKNFENGKIATHNDKIDYQKRYNEWQNNFQRNDDGSIKTRYDRINDEEVAVLRKNTDKTGNNYNYSYEARDYIDKGRPSGSNSVNKDHTISAAEIMGLC